MFFIYFVIFNFLLFANYAIFEAGEDNDFNLSTYLKIYFLIGMFAFIFVPIIVVIKLGGKLHG